MRFDSLAAIVLTGFAAAIGQILVLRELLVLFYGNELSTGLVLTTWLVWTAVGSGLGARFSARLRRDGPILTMGLLLLASLLPLMVLWIRSSRLVWSIPPGELVTPVWMIAISLSATSLFCLLSGFMFTFCWKSYLAAAPSEEPRPIQIYLGEAVGAAMGGLAFYFVLLPRAATFVAACLTSLTILTLAAALLRPWRHVHKVGPVVMLTGVAGSALLMATALFSPYLDRTSHSWQWGPNLLAVRDTPYNNLALVEHGDQLSLFGNGLWFFSIPDPKSAEYAVHLALLQHPLPRTVLLIGGGAFGMVPEILKHPSITRVDVVEPDPEVIKLTAENLPNALTRPLRDPRVELHHQDAGSFVKYSPKTYDVILSSLGDPMNAELNRFYTVEFYTSIRRLLNADGIFSFAVSAADILGPVQVRLLRSHYHTVCSVFPEVVVWLAESARFFTATTRGLLNNDLQQLLERIAARSLELQYVREYYLFDLLSPIRRDYLNALLETGSSRNLNRDFTPTCYFNNLLLWASQLHPNLEKALIALTEIRPSRFWLALTALLTVLIAVSWCGWLGRTIPCQLSVMIMGGAQLAFEIVLLLVFQILQGFVYQQLALVVTFFMSGVALGAGIQSLLGPAADRRWFIGVQCAFAVYVLVVLKGLHLMHEPTSEVFGIVPAPVIFSVLAVAAGMLGGLHFALALKVISAAGAASAATAGRIYAVDLIGAAAGAAVTSIYILPVYGVTTTMLALCLASLSGALAQLEL
ncbi:MAG: fused MFS/spermidine synthase [Desulforhabdus sp.]|jgi:spermidine synthase|nr:fused MFS/spermidine synthase [Desulforhabdus sp.]